MALDSMTTQVVKTVQTTSGAGMVVHMVHTSNTNPWVAETDLSL